MTVAKKASEILDDMYKKAAMEVPSDKEKKIEHIPETHVDKAVADENKAKKLLSICKKRCS